MPDRLRLCALAFRLPCDALLSLVDNPTPSNAAIGVGGCKLGSLPFNFGSWPAPGYLQKCADSVAKVGSIDWRRNVCSVPDEFLNLRSNAKDSDESMLRAPWPKNLLQQYLP
jgi:hypothetical protein